VDRRRFLLTTLAIALTPPLTTEAQQAGRTYRLGAMIPLGREHPAMVAFFDELRLFGFIENQNLTVIPGGFKIGNDQLADHAAALVKAAPDVILSGPDNYTRVMQQTTRTIPLIAMTEDMVAAGFVTSLARPGGNTTGISLLSPELDGKRQEILIEAVPGLHKMAALADSTVTPQRHLRALQDAARLRGVDLAVFGVARREEVLPAIEAAKAAGAEALNLLATPLFVVNSRIFIDRIVALRLPAMHQWPELAEDGGLMGYGSRFTKTLRQLARLVVSVLRGVKPANIPVEQPIHFELVINLKTARALGLKIPQSLLVRADQVIE
jgi:putative ABC transport system substrate-binding protein